MKKLLTDCKHCNGTGQVEDRASKGARLRKFRESQLGPRSLRKLAREMGISAPFLSDMELGERRFPDEQLAAYNAGIAKLAKLAKLNKPVKKASAKAKTGKKPAKKTTKHEARAKKPR